MGGTRVDISRTYNQLPPFRSVSSHLDSPVSFRMFDFMRFSKQILTILDGMLFSFFQTGDSQAQNTSEGSEKQLSALASSVSLCEKTAQILPLILSSFHCFLLLLRLFLSLFLFLRMKQLIAEKAAVFLSSVLFQLSGVFCSLKKKKKNKKSRCGYRRLSKVFNFQSFFSAYQ